MGEAVNVLADEDMEFEGGAVAERPPDRGDVVDVDGDVDMEAAGGDAVTAHAVGDGAAFGVVGLPPHGVAADVGPSSAALSRPGRGSARRAGRVARASGPRIVTGFGAERIDDVRVHEDEMDANALERHDVRVNEGGRGRMRDAEDRDLDRSEHAFSSRRR